MAGEGHRLREQGDGLEQSGAVAPEFPGPGKLTVRVPCSPCIT